jgi:cytochrome c oxidase subunit 2
MNWLRDWMLPSQNSAYARDYDFMYMSLVGLSAFFFLLIAGLCLFFVVRYKRRPNDGPTPHITHNLTLELVWTIIPLIIVIGIFFWGFHGYMNATVAPGDALEIQVTGKKWLWTFEYPDGMRTINEIHVPVHKAVRLIMTSEDVIHSFYIPGMRIKQDVVPGRYTEEWFRADQDGFQQVFCAEYCGKSHSKMMAKIFVDTPAKYAEWLEKGDEFTQTAPLKEVGQRVWENRGCKECHSIDGVRGQGPSFKGIWMKMEKMSDGKMMQVEANYVRESILYPQAKVVAGFEPIMPTFQGLLREREILGVIEYIKSLQ